MLRLGYRGAVTTATYAIREVEEDVGILEVHEGPNAGAAHELAQASCVIGSSASAHIHLDDQGVSRMHCEVVREGRRLRVRDLGSKNGTWIDGVRVIEAYLPPEGMLKVGGSKLRVSLGRRKMKRGVWTGGDRFGAMVGASPVMHQLYARVAQLGESDSTVLVTGESGTGKELVARTLHEAGARAEGPLVVVDGASLSRTLAESELFGHVRGAFTGAERDRAGAFERAHGGTLFLDEVGELPPEVQAKLLRVLETRVVKRVGGTGARKVDVRIVAATHRPLLQMVAEGTFRADLFHRLAVITLKVPPLRERGDDLRLLARRFLAALTDDPRALASLDEALAQEAGYRWPGNVRELKGFVLRLATLGTTWVELSDRLYDEPNRIRVDLDFSEAKTHWLGLFERQYLASVLDECGGNVSAAARRCGLSRSRVHQLLAAHGLR